MTWTYFTKIIWLVEENWKQQTQPNPELLLIYRDSPLPGSQMNISTKQHTNNFVAIICVKIVISQFVEQK